MMATKTTAVISLAAIAVAGVVHLSSPQPAKAQAAIVSSSNTVLARQTWMNALSFEGRMCEANMRGNDKAKLFWAAHLGKALKDYASATGRIDRLPPCSHAIALLPYENKMP